MKVDEIRYRVQCALDEMERLINEGVYHVSTHKNEDIKILNFITDLHSLTLNKSIIEPITINDVYEDTATGNILEVVSLPVNKINGKDMISLRRKVKDDFVYLYLTEVELRSRRYVKLSNLQLSIFPRTKP